jgi:hypothetical protein
MDSLARRVLGDELVDAFEQVDLEVVEESVEVLSGDELARRYLAPETEKSLSKVDLRSEGFGLQLDVAKVRFLNVEVEGLHMAIGARGMSLILAVLTVMALLIGVGPAVAILQTLLNGM